jgi:hypothetical protein
MTEGWEVFVSPALPMLPSVTAKHLISLLAAQFLSWMNYILSLICWSSFQGVPILKQ